MPARRVYPVYWNVQLVINITLSLVNTSSEFDYGYLILPSDPILFHKENKQTVDTMKMIFFGGKVSVIYSIFISLFCLLTLSLPGVSILKIK